MDEGIAPNLIDAARRVVAANKEAGRTIVVAESCTGGLVSAAITAIPGSSAVFQAGYITYSDDAKVAMIAVASDILETFGAVSVATAWKMAQGALEKSGADAAVAITGIAGPDGGSDQKPVGTVVFARALKGQDSEDIMADTRQFGDLGRGPIRIQAALVALELLMP